VIGIAAAVLTLAVVWVLFVPAADWLANHDVSSAKGSLLATARDAARGRLLTLGAGLFAAGALLFTALTFNLSRRTFQQAEQGQVTDRYTKAIDQLGSDRLDVRIGGIYALERIARDSPRDHPTVMEVLTAFIRDPHHEQRPRTDVEPETPMRRPHADVQAAITVIGRRNRKGDIQRIDLSGAYLKDVTLSGDFSDAFLPDVNLSGGGLAEHGRLHGAFLLSANLTDGFFVGSDLVGVTLSRADLTGAHMNGVHLEGADLADVTFTGTELVGAHLKGANLLGRGVTDLTAAYLTYADLTDAVLSENSPVPDGWQRDDASGRLRRADQDPGAIGS
jgi:hypothetical protein